MVSLRERKARPSYANVSQELANLTDEEDELDSDAADGAEGKDGVKVEPGQKEGDGDEPMDSSSEAAGSQVAGGDEDDSMSSGDSSEFAPSDAETGKGKGGGGKAGARGKAGAVGLVRRSTTRQRSASSGSDPGSGTDEDGMVPEDVAEELRELGDVDDDDDDEGQGDSDLEALGTPPPIHTKAQGKAKPRVQVKVPSAHPPAKLYQAARSTPASPGIGSTDTRQYGGPSADRKRGRPLAAAPTYLQSDLNLLPAAYRSMIKTAAEGMVKLPPTKTWQHDKARAYSETGFPGGHPVPFITRLTRSPAKCTGNQGTEEWVKVEKAPSRNRRRNRAVNLGEGMTAGLPWEGWEGETWWPDMYTGSAAASSTDGQAGPSTAGQKARFKGWRLREDVKLGLEDVGRSDYGKMGFLSESEAAVYLPSGQNSPGTPAPAITVHVGKHDAQQPISMKRFEHVGMGAGSSTYQSSLISAGGPIWGMDWCPQPAEHGHTQYLAITALPELGYPVPMGRKLPRSTPGAIQIWSVTPPTPGTGTGTGETSGLLTRCEMVLCVQGGPVWACKWMPMGAWDGVDGEMEQGRLPKLGILATVQLDGTVSMYAVSHPAAVRRFRGNTASGQEQPMFVRCHEPLLRIEMPDAAATCIDWYTGSKLAVGYSNGYIAVWNVVQALTNGDDGCVLPDSYVNVAQSCVSSIAVARLPPSDGNGDPIYGADPVYLLVGCYDGVFGIVDMRDPSRPFTLNRARIPYYKVAWSSQNQVPLFPDSEHSVSLYKIRGIPSHRYNNITSHRGVVWDVATSDYHTMITSVGADGAVLLGSTQLGFYRGRKAPLYLHRMLELDYDQTSGEYRLITDLIPETMTLETAGGRKTSRNKLLGQDDPTAIKTANWAPQVGIHRAVWNNAGGLARAGMLACGTASGLGFIQVVEPRWRKGFGPAAIAGS